MPEYRVRWEMDVEARSPVEAAMLTVGLMPKQVTDSQTVFEVVEHGTRDLLTIDLYQIMQDAWERAVARASKVEDFSQARQMLAEELDVAIDDAVAIMTERTAS